MRKCLGCMCVYIYIYILQQESVSDREKIFDGEIMFWFCVLFQFYNKNDQIRVTDLHQGIVWGTNTPQVCAHVCAYGVRSCVLVCVRACVTLRLLKRKLGFCPILFRRSATRVWWSNLTVGAFSPNFFSDFLFSMLRRRSATSVWSTALTMTAITERFSTVSWCRSGLFFFRFLSLSGRCSALF